MHVTGMATALRAAGSRRRLLGQAGAAVAGSLPLLAGAGRAAAQMPPATVDRSALDRSIAEQGVVAIIRVPDLTDAVAIAGAVADGGGKVVEFTLTNPDALRAITEVRAALGDRVIAGAGSVLDPESARAAILAGAEFVITPTVNPATVALCHRYGVPTAIGALTPTEILAAFEAGATYVKLFPAFVGGPDYLRAVLGPLPQVPLIPTGGVSPANAADYVRAGAVAVSVADDLISPARVAARDWAGIAADVAAVREAVAAARGS